MELGSCQGQRLVHRHLDHRGVGLAEPDKALGQLGELPCVGMAKHRCITEALVEWVVADEADRLIADLLDPAGLIRRSRVLFPFRDAADTHNVDAERLGNELKATAEPEYGKRAGTDDLSKRSPVSLVVHLLGSTVTTDKDRPHTVLGDQFVADPLVALQQTRVTGEVFESVGNASTRGKEPLGAIAFVDRCVFVVDVDDHAAGPITTHRARMGS